MVEALHIRGWADFPPEPGLLKWARAARAAVMPVLDDAPRECEGTWTVGVDALPNDPDGRVAGVPFDCAARAAAEALWGRLALHRAQVSVVRPGYPRPRSGEGTAAYRYRLRRDGAHVDGLLPVGEGRRRKLRERHAWLMGLPLNVTGTGASPLVVWEGSHLIMRRVFVAALECVDPADWGDVDLTESYQAARREVFETCMRVTIHAKPGAAFLVHRMALHGIAPWQAEAKAPPEGRMVAYFRPEFGDDSRDDWLSLP